MQAQESKYKLKVLCLEQKIQHQEVIIQQQTEYIKQVEAIMLNRDHQSSLQQSTGRLNQILPKLQSTEPSNIEVTEPPRDDDENVLVTDLEHLGHETEDSEANLVDSDEELNDEKNSEANRRLQEVGTMNQQVE